MGNTIEDDKRDTVLKLLAIHHIFTFIYGKVPAKQIAEASGVDRVVFFESRQSLRIARSSTSCTRT